MIKVGEIKKFINQKIWKCLIKIKWAKLSLMINETYARTKIWLIVAISLKIRILYYHTSSMDINLLSNLCQKNQVPNLLKIRSIFHKWKTLMWLIQDYQLATYWRQLIQIFKPLLMIAKMKQLLKIAMVVWIQKISAKRIFLM